MHYFFLEKDALVLRSKAEATKQQMLESAKDASIQSSQSSETWHDNFGFEDAVRQQRFLSKRISEIYELQDKMRIVKPAAKTDKVEIGLEVVLEDTETHETKSVIVGSYMVLDQRFPNEISYDAPLIKAFMGARKGATKKIEIGGQTKHYKIVEIKIPTTN